LICTNEKAPTQVDVMIEKLGLTAITDMFIRLCSMAPGQPDVSGYEL